MILTSVLLTFVTLAAASQAQPAADAAGDAVRVNTVLLPDGRLQIWEISRDRMARLPAGPATSVSFTGEQANTIARLWLSRQVPETKEWTAQGDTTVFNAGPGTGVIVPRPIAVPAPHYTSDAMRARMQGRVSLAPTASR